ncbi:MULTISPECIES: ABC transporter permease [unclassified Rhizobium]|uniref:ABC transporter permease n=1 Tax=unclassified Rhizobium TaxID=2613769 RepID=UPI001AD9C7D5|nr:MULTISPECIES: ABC transporter permease [unclassified Rhizobium]MBO9127898.1 ABC transporter permease [Rhizobium sp. 16-488-2b]MBO9178292.1 ABC transporter permease [Rhizobium sp. 16-488-2a]
MSNIAGSSAGTTAHSPRKINLSGWRAEIGVAVALAALIVFFSFNSANFLTAENWATLLQQTSVIAILAVGMTFVIITGEIDLSVGAQVGLSGTLFALLSVNHGISLPLAFLIVLVEAAAVGAFVGALRVIWGIPTFITTLGLLSGLRGIAFYVSDGLTISPLPSSFGNLWYATFLGLSFPVWVMIVAVLLGWFVLSQHRFGQHVYAVGGNPDTATRYGVKVARLRIAVMIMIQLLAAISGVLLASRLNAGTPTVGELMELDVIAAVIVGGTVLTGGVGRIIGTLIGVFFVAVLRNGMILNGLDPVLFLIAQGFVIILAVWWSMLRKRQS